MKMNADQILKLLTENREAWRGFTVIKLGKRGQGPDPSIAFVRLVSRR